MIKAIEIKSTEECPWRKWNIRNEIYCSAGNEHLVKITSKAPIGCVGCDSPDCPLNAIRCGSCKHKSYCSVYHVVNEAISEDGFCSGYEAV